jgi:hypothetical protein
MATSYSRPKTQLVVFRRLEGSNTDDNLGKVFVQVLKEIGCLDKVSRNIMTAEP